MSNKKNWQIFLFFFLLLAILIKPAASGNDGSRLATIEALTDFHSFIIDNSRFIFTPDKYLYQGHFYSDKPPILAIYGSLFYSLLKLFGISFRNQLFLAYYLLTLLVVVALTSLGLVYFYKTIRLLGSDDRWATIVVLIVGTGTLILPYSSVLNNHTVSGALLMIGFYYVIRGQESIKYSLLSGLLITLAGSVDIACFIFVPCFAINFVDKSLKSKLAFIFSCLLILCIYFSLNIYTSGSWMPPAMNPPLWKYPGSEFNNSNDLTGVASHHDILSLLEYAFHMLIGNRGLISYTPILIFSIFGFVKALSNSEFRYRREYLLIIFGSSIYILQYIFKSNNYSGWAYGVRWYADLMFLLCVPLGNIGNEVERSKAFRKTFLLLAFLSIIISFTGVIEPFIWVTEDHPSSFINALYYTARPIQNAKLEAYAKQASLIYKLKFVRLIIIISVASVVSRLFSKLVSSSAAKKQVSAGG